jgi:hypothetical protein
MSELNILSSFALSSLDDLTPRVKLSPNVLHLNIPESVSKDTYTNPAE